MSDDSHTHRVSGDDILRLEARLDDLLARLVKIENGSSDLDEPGPRKLGHRRHRSRPPERLTDGTD